MPFDSLFAELETWLVATTTGLTGYALFWILLIAMAAIELLRPGRAPRIRPGPRIAVNIGLGIVNAALVLLPFLSEIALAEFVRQQQIGLLNRFALPVWATLLAGLLLFDLGYYARHRIEHQWPLLWRLHRVHHSDADIDLSTTFRTHPIDALFGIGFNLALIALLGISPAAVALHAFLRQLVMTWGHANLRPSPRLSRVCAWLVVTPEFHTRHHSSAQVETDSNYAIVFTFWDRLLGTHCSRTGPIERFGLGDAYDADSADLAAQMRLPFVSR